MSNINNPGLSNPSVALTGVPTAPTATLGTNTNQIATTAFVQANAGGGSTAAVLGRRRQMFASADGTTTTLGTNGSNSTGGDVLVIAGSVVAEAATAAAGPSVGIFASATNQVTGLSGNANYRTGRNIIFWGLCGAAGKITDERWWFGVTDQTLATQGASANPAGNYAAFRFDTTASDTVWQCITKDGTAQNIQSSGVAPIINTPQTFAIIFNDSTPNVQFYINGALVATSTSHLPSVSTNLRFVFTNECFVSTTNNGLTFEQIFMASDL